jgi:hypothetical protein
MKDNIIEEDSKEFRTSFAGASRTDHFDNMEAGQINNSNIVLNHEQDNYRVSVKSSMSTTQQKAQDRYSMRASSPDNKNYNRFKYYSALRTGFKHIGAEEEALQILEPPKHVIDEDLFVINLPFMDPGKILERDTL